MQPGKQQLESTQLNPGEPTAGSAQPQPRSPDSNVETSPAAASLPAGSTEARVSRSSSRSGNEPGAGSNGTLREQVREALVSVLTDIGASAAAKASAGRTLLEFFDEAGNEPGKGRQATELTLEELDAEIARAEARLTKGP